MAQSEDTELRDLVIEALDKNGSLAKVRALLRANVFLAFENECENMKQNVRLDNILKSPEGIVALSIVHEFLEFCNLKNTLFVYMAESRQKKEYFYQGKKILSEKLKLNCQGDKVDEPVLISIIKTSLHLSNGSSPNDKGLSKDEQNCTYIVHEDSVSTASSSQSDTSSDEKNKLHLCLKLDNSDTDTSSDSARDKQCSEYIANEHIILDTASYIQNKDNKILDLESNQKETHKDDTSEKDKMKTQYLGNSKLSNNSSESTSYIDLKSSFADVRNETGLQKDLSKIASEIGERESTRTKEQVNIQPLHDQPSPTSISNISTLSKNETLPENSADISHKKAVDQKSSSEYSFDFTSSLNKDKDFSGKNPINKLASQDLLQNSPNKNSPLDTSHHNSPRSLSSVSVDDVADLILSESIVSDHETKNDDGIKSKLSPGNNPNRIINLDSNKISDDSGDFSESPIPSLSNLSLDIHSD